MLHTASNRHNHSYGAFSHPNGLVHVRDCDLLLGALVLVENLERIGRKFTRSIMPHKVFLFVELRLNLSYACRDEASLSDLNRKQRPFIQSLASSRSTANICFHLNRATNIKV